MEGQRAKMESQNNILNKDGEPKGRNGDPRPGCTPLHSTPRRKEENGSTDPAFLAQLPN